MNKAISIKNVKKILGNREVLKGISFDVEKREIFGYLGPNGAGKTTTIRILLGLLKADSGSLSILGQDINLSETRKKIGFILDTDGLYDNMTAEENLTFYLQIYGLSTAEVNLDKLLTIVDLKGREKEKVSTYSRGMRQRLALARAMAHDPEVLIMDEPTAGVDPDIARKEDKTIFLSSHNLDEVQRICSRIALIDRGEIKLYGGLKNLRKKMGRGIVLIKTSGKIPGQLLLELKSVKKLGFQKKSNTSLTFSPMEGIEVSDLISFLASRGIKIEEAVKKEASLEELYAAILKEVEL
jgi:ABC-2 type transport system ATP-binding protein